MNNSTLHQIQNKLSKHSKLFISLLLALLLIVPLLPISLAHLTKAKASRSGASSDGGNSSGTFASNAAPRPKHSDMPDMPHLLAATYYSLNHNLNATLMLSNQGPHPIEVQPTLFSLSGQRFDVAPLTIQGNTVQSIDLREYSIMGTLFEEGSLQVAYTGKDMEIGGVLKLVDTERSLIFDEELTEPAMMFASSRLEGIWWLPSHKSEIRLIVSNTTNDALTVTMSVNRNAQEQKDAEDLTLGAHETRVVDVREFAAKRGKTSSEIGGISITHSGVPGALLARGLIQDASTGYSNVVEFSDPQTAKSSRLDGAGLRIGEIAGEQLTQVAVMRNVGDSPTVVTGRMPYTTTDSKTGIISLPQTRLASGEVREIKLAEAIKASGLKEVKTAGLQFGYSGLPGGVLVSALSVSSSGNHVFRVPVVDSQAQASSTGKYPWAIEGSASTMVYIKNTTERSQRYQMQINYEGGAYALGIKTLAAGQTVAFDVRALRDNQVPDESKHTIPLDATHGQVFWAVDGPKNFVLIGRAEQVDTVRGLSFTSACQCHCPPNFYNGWCTPGSVVGLPGDTSQFTAMKQKQDCLGNLLAPTIANDATWSSTDTTVATVDSTGFATAQGAGTANIQASFNDVTWDYASGCACSDTCSPTAHCCLSNVTSFVASAVCNVAQLRASVISPPIGNDGDAIIAGQQFAFQVEAVYRSGQRATSVNTTASLSFSGGTGIPGESIPGNLTISNGVGATQITLQVVLHTGDRSRSYSVHATNGFGTGDAVGSINVWFYVSMDVERWKNCGFVTCPFDGSYFCQMSCPPYQRPYGSDPATPYGSSQPIAFMSLTSPACDSSVIARRVATGVGAVTVVKEVGPTTRNPYWTNGNIPTGTGTSGGGCLSDLLANALGIPNSCNTGREPIVWRFQ